MTLVGRRPARYVPADGSEIFPQRVEFGPQRNGLNILRLMLNLEAIDDVILPAKFRELGRVLVLELFDVDLETTRLHCEFRAQEILVGLNFSHRLRDRVLDTPQREPHAREHAPGNYR